MLRRTAQLSVGLLVAFCPILLSGQAAQPQYYVFCAAQAAPSAPGGVATVYYSGILQGTAANLVSFRTDFTQFLMQKYAYKGAAACAPRTTMADAQTMMANQETAFRNAKRNVVETGWTEGGAGGILSGGSGGGANPLSSISNPLGSILGGGKSNTAAPSNQPNTSATSAQPAAGAGQATGRGGAGGGNVAGANGGGGNGGGRGGNGGGGNGGGNQSAFSNVFGQIFGTNGGGGGGGNGGGNGGKSGQGQPNPNAKPGQEGPAATGGTGGGGNSGGGGNQSPFAQVSSVIFGNRGGGNGGGGNNGGGRGGQPGQPGQPGGGNTVAGNNGPKPTGAPGQPTAPIGAEAQAAQSGVLGSAQFGTTKLDIYGCARQDMQVACVTELTNQNPKDTLVKSTDIWKDAFVVDDRGDRHTRSNAFFLNVDGEQRQQLDISNGKTAKFVLMFDQVPTKVQSVALRSQTGNMDVENIGLVAPDGAPSATPASAPAPAPTPPPTQH